MELIFWILCAVIVYTYAGYPLLLIILTSVRKKKVIKKPVFPSVSLIITAFNEELCIGEKIRNSLELNYPENLLEIIAVSDGSTDKTNEIVKNVNSPLVKVIINKKQNGKTACQNIAAEKAKGEILVFTDANSMFERDALQKLVRNFADVRVGGVCGELKYCRETGEPESGSENVYWKLEKFIKKRESILYSTLGANGAIYALRKNLYTPLPDDIISDLIQGLLPVGKKSRMVYEHEAIAWEKHEPDFGKEFQRKQRIIMRSFYSLIKYREFFNPFRYGIVSFQLISHKLLRWFIPLFLLLVLVSNIFLYGSLFFKVFLYFQIAFYIVSLFTYVFNVKNRYLSMCVYFCLVNCASLAALIKVIMGKRIISWTPSRGK